jgi:hypothetical protein
LPLAIDLRAAARVGAGRDSSHGLCADLCRDCVCVISG